MIRQLVRLAATVSILVLVVSGGDIRPRVDAQHTAATPTPYYPEGVTAVKLARTMPPLLGQNANLAMQRLTYQPGSAYTFVRPYPVLMYVESGSLRFAKDGDHFAISGPQTNPGQPVITNADSSGIVLEAGYSVYSETGNIGSTRNEGTVPTVLTIIAVVTQPTGVQGSSSATSGSIATPDS